MVPIYTKRMPNGKWSCFGTFDGYDFAFVSDSKEQSQMEMKDKLNKRDLEGHGLFMEEKIYYPLENKPKCNWRPPFIDFNPIG